MMLSLLGAPAWNRNAQSDTAAGLEKPDTAIVATLPSPHEPTAFPIARVGFAGIMKGVERIVSTVFTPLPKGPPTVIASRASAARAGHAARSPIVPAAVYSPVPSVEQTAPYWDYLT